ncbi:MAG: cytidine deaminase [Verrucomicrobiota bacterium]
MSDTVVRTKRGSWRIVGEKLVAPNDLWDELIAEARKVQENAYAPYSKFRVGAAALVDGTIYKGCNVENASYGGTICAERSAIFSAVAAGARDLEMIAITTDAKDKEPIESRSPCGFCRQVMSEFAGPETLVLLDNGSSEEADFTGEVIFFDDLLPWRFRLS